jgi:hypothetical protein
MAIEKISMLDVFKLLELLGWTIESENWYDEEGIDGTCLVSPNKKEYYIYGWGEECDIKDIIKVIENNNI